MGGKEGGRSLAWNKLDCLTRLKKSGLVLDNHLHCTMTRGRWKYKKVELFGATMRAAANHDESQFFGGLTLLILVYMHV